MSPKLTVNETATLVTVFVFQLFIHLFSFIKNYFSPKCRTVSHPWCSALCHPVGIHFASSVTLWASLWFVIHPSSVIILPKQGRPGEGSENGI